MLGLGKPHHLTCSASTHFNLYINSQYMNTLYTVFWPLIVNYHSHMCLFNRRSLVLKSYFNLRQMKQNWLRFRVQRSSIWRCHIRSALKRKGINCGLPRLRWLVYLWPAAFALCLPPPLDNFIPLFVSLHLLPPVTDLQFSQTLLGRPVPFATAGDCYSAAKCPQVGGSAPITQTLLPGLLALSCTCCHLLRG